ncbi:protein SIEVE ELEMENT OCCLUSION B-like [Fagus crenata]
MASKEAPGTAQQAIEYEIMHVPTGYKYNNEENLNQIDSIHVTGGGEFDTESLFIMVKNIVNYAAPIVGSYVPGAQLPLENMEDKDMAPSVCFNSPFCTLKQISCKMASKAWGEVNAHETTLAILDMLSSYSCDARAVMTLAAFTLDYGKFWLLMQIHTSDQLAKSMAFLKGLPVLAEHSGLQKRQQALAELNNLIKVTLEVIKCIFELEKLPNYGRENVPALSKALYHIPLDSYWVIRTVIGCSTQMTGLISDDMQCHEKGLNADEIFCLNVEETETVAYQMLTNLFQIRPKIDEFFKALCYGKSNVLQLIDGSNEVYFDVLKHKYVLLLISGPDITDKDLSTLKQLRKEIGSRGKVVWVPIVVQSKTTIDIERKFRSLGSEVPMYIVHQFLPIPGIKFIKEEWHFTNKPIVVVINPKVKVEHHILVEQIRGINSFPCLRKKRIELLVGGLCSCVCQCCLCVHVPTSKCCQR